LKEIAMQRLMMDYPLTVTSMLERARRMFPNKEIVTKAGPSLERMSYARMIEGVGRLANALARLGVKPGDRGRPLPGTMPATWSSISPCRV
jgi:acyl-CoA synthetase (AMP-forming)/AMP-acid ligase II